MINNIYKQRILILDFGSQYTQLIARRVRTLGVYCEICSWNLTEKQIRKFNPNGIILSGGPHSTTELNSPKAPDYVFKAMVPVLGICYGMQTMAIQLGGKVQVSSKRELGYAQVKVFYQSKLVSNIQDNIGDSGQYMLDVWMSHVDNVTAIPSDFVNVASTETCQFAIIANEKKRFYGIQFHPEVTHTCQGQRILERFIMDICQCEPMWTPVNIMENIVTSISQQVGNDQVILGLSGGVDSTVTAMLLHQAIGKQLTCVFVDNGLLRINEVRQVMEMFAYCEGLNIIHISAAERFLNALTGIKDPEAKRKTIGKVFTEVFDEQALLLNNVKWLVHGTIYTDIIESATSDKMKTNVIKSHHNVGGLPKKMNLMLLEPLKELFKEEVRKIGLELGLPYNMLYRHPFPGPGLSVRILGEIKKEYCDLLRHADNILLEELHQADLYHTVSQAFAVFLPIRSVGVMGDNRIYDWVIALRAVTTIDFMTANWAKLPYCFLEKVSNRIINEIEGISRVVYDISSKPPATIEWE